VQSCGAVGSCCSGSSSSQEGGATRGQWGAAEGRGDGGHRGQEASRADEGCRAVLAGSLDRGVFWLWRCGSEGCVVQGTTEHAHTLSVYLSINFGAAPVSCCC
jgi:hypothetical protein